MTALGGAASAWPLAVRAQQSSVHHLGFLSAGTGSDAFSKDNAAALLQGLEAFGWKEGVTLKIDWRWLGDDAALAERQAAELVALRPDVLFAGGNSALDKLAQQTKTIPLVFALVSDPVGMGYVKSLSHPGGNATGFTSYDPPNYTRQLQMFTEIAPQAKTIAILYNPDTAPYAGRMLRAMEEAATSIGVTVRDAPCHDDTEIGAAMAVLSQDGSGGLLALGDPFNQVHRGTIITLALKYKIPTVVNTRQMIESGGLMSYIVDIPDLYRRSASYIDRILKGEMPSALPVQNPIKFELIVNLKTAKALSVTIAPHLLNNADEVIE